jgi:hypothetical protein
MNPMQLTISKGLDFLLHRQLPQGNFSCEVAEATSGLNEDMEHFDTGDRKGWVSIDNTNIFPATLTGLCLLHATDFPQTEKILKKIDQLLLRERHTFGVWNHYLPESPVYTYLPHDVDDTACALDYLKRRGIPQSENHSVFFANRNSEGLFYTWFTARKEWNPSLRYWLISMKELRHPLIIHAFWKGTESSRYDIDAVVNNNVVLWLGERPETLPAIHYIVEQVKSGKESEFDLYYSNLHTIWYFLSKNLREGRPSFEPIRDILLQRILETLDPDGTVRGQPLETALTLCSLLNLGRAPESFPAEPMIQFLQNSQQPDGFWKKRVVYKGGRKYIYGWGSEEMVTGFVLEALARYHSIKRMN